MEVFGLSGEDEEYLSIERKGNLQENTNFELNDKKEILQRIINIENVVYNNQNKFLENHHKDIKILYDKIMILEEKIMNFESQNSTKSFTEYLDEIWDDFKNFVKVSI